jgi:uncharacterized protein YjbI with pentapeptide repeats
MNDFVRAHFTKLNKGRPFLSYFQAWVSTLLAWWLVPITLFLFWGRYMRRHELFWTICHAFLLAVAIISAVRLYRIAGETLRGNERESFSWKDVISRRSTYVRLAFATTLIAVLVVISVSAIYGSANSSMSRMMEAAGYSLFANINNADVCIKPPNWTGKSVAELDLVTGANLAWKDLRHAHGYQSFFVHANLEGSQMEESSLVFADFRRASARGIHLDDALMLSSRLNEADLTVASMKRANLSKASLVSSELSQAHLENAKFSETDLTAARLVGSNLTSAIFDKTIIKYADFRGAQGLTRDAIKNGCIDWQHAYFSPDMLTQLDLSSDHNEKLEREMEAELLATAFATAVPANSKP